METSDTHHFSGLLILLGIAGLTIPFLHRLKISPVLGFLLCGVLVGPYGISSLLKEHGFHNLLTDNEEVIQNFSELGIIFLMFMIGLHLSLRELWQMRRHVAGLGSCQIIVTAFVIFLIARMFGNPLEISILLGACFALSSTAVVMQLFDEKKSLDSPTGKTCFSILLMQDLAIVPILTMLNVFADRSGESPWLLMAKAILIAMFSIVTIYVAGMKILEPALRYLRSGTQPEWLMSFVLFVVIGSSMLTEAAGLSFALGAFLAGLLLAETEYREQIKIIIAPVKGLLLGVFFLSIGMLIDPAVIKENPLWIFLSVLGLGALKAAILFFLCLIFKLRPGVSTETAIMLGQSGEFVFLITAMALGEGVISLFHAQFFMIVTALSMMMTPFMAMAAPHAAAHIEVWFDRKKNGR